jgi:putative transposase
MPSRLRRHDEPGHVHFLTVSTFRRLQFFRHVSVRNTFVDAMKSARESYPIRWIGYVVMPEHVHLLVLPQISATAVPVPISVVLRSLKGFAGRMGKAALRDVWRRDRSLGTLPLDAWATGTGEKPSWKPRGYDHNIIQEAALLEKLQYMHANPVRRGLVDHPEKWPWNSCRFYECADDSLIGMDWDGGFPLL